MIIALLMMQNTIGRSSKGKANIKRMINHACTFLLFVFGFVYMCLDNLFYHGAHYYTDWYICAILGTGANFCMCYLLWHLGTKELKYIEHTTLNDEDTTAMTSRMTDDDYDDDEAKSQYTL